MFSKAKNKIKLLIGKLINVVKEEEGGGEYTQTLVNILLAIVLGGIVVAGMVGIVKNDLIPGLANKITELFNMTF